MWKFKKNLHFRLFRFLKPRPTFASPGDRHVSTLLVNVGGLEDMMIKDGVLPLFSSLLYTAKINNYR